MAYKKHVNIYWFDIEHKYGKYQPQPTQFFPNNQEAQEQAIKQELKALLKKDNQPDHWIVNKGHF